MPETTETRPGIAKRLGGSALGGVAAQGSQAVGSFILQFVTARALGLEGLGTFAVVYTFIVLATAISSGFVGDSLTVLDRTDRKIRSALQTWALMITLTSATAFSLVSLAVDFLSPWESLLFGVAAAMFVIEDLVRRLLMATLDFWRIVVVDVVALLGALTVFVAVDQIAFSHVLIALSLGQGLAFCAGVAILPATERFAVGWVGGGLRAVAAFGVWRSLQQALRAGTMAAMRVVLLLAVTATAVGGLELARIYMAPAALCVSGVSSYLFASYAAARGSAAERLRLADRATVVLLGTIGAVGVVAVLAVPLLGPFFTPDDVDGAETALLSTIAVAGWAAFAATTAAVTPYAQLAAVLGRQRGVFAVRSAESVVSLLAMLAVVEITGSVNWAPLALAATALPTGILIRRYFIVADMRRDDALEGK